MGKKYFCEYCNCRMKDSVEIIRKHIEGFQHKIARQDHYARFKDARTLLEEGSKKVPCIRVEQCKYGASCRFNHLTAEQIVQLEQIVNQMDYMDWLRQQPKQFDEQQLNDFLQRRKECPIDLRETVKELWTYPSAHDKSKVALWPPSLQRIDPHLMPAEFPEWGS